MENVTISRETLEFMTRLVLDYQEYTEVRHESDRITIGHLQDAITALDLQGTLDREEKERVASENARYKAVFAARREAEEAGN